MSRNMIQEKQKFMAIIKFLSHVSHEQIKGIIKELGFTETTASKGDIKVYIFDSNPLDFFSMKEKLESSTYSNLFTLIDIGLAPEFELIPVQDTSNNPWSILEWLETGISNIAAEIGWILEEPNLVYKGARTTISYRAEDSEISTENNQHISKLLTIAGNNYKLIISLVSKDNNEWKIALQNAEAGGKIPHGFKLRLLDENGDNFPNNEAKALEEGETEIYIKVQLELGEGLIWEVEPIPNEYQRQVMYF